MTAIIAVSEKATRTHQGTDLAGMRYSNVPMRVTG